MIDLNAFLWGVGYAYAGIGLLLLLGDQYQTLCRGRVTAQMIAGLLWPATLWFALAMWLWQRRREHKVEEWI